MTRSACQTDAGKGSNVEAWAKLVGKTMGSGRHRRVRDARDRRVRTKQGQRNALGAVVCLRHSGLGLSLLSLPTSSCPHYLPSFHTMSADLRRTYTTRSANPKPLLPSSPTSELTSPPSNKRKRPFADRPTEQNTPSKKPRRSLKAQSKASKPNNKTKGKQPKLTQLHFSLDTPTLRTCPLCDLSYTRGAPDDESLHKAHCSRVQRGLEWGKEETREEVNGGVEELQGNIKLRNGLRGRIICFRAEIGGKIGAKVRRSSYATLYILDTGC